MIYKSDRFTDAMITFFLTFLALEFVFGTIFYKKQFQFLTGWVHHTVYIAMAWWALKKQFTAAPVTLFPMEIPTFILGLGSLFPKFRSDLGFGISFFCTRVVILMAYLKGLIDDRHKDPKILLWPFISMILCLHLFWFYEWVVGYRKRSKKAKMSPVNKKPSPF